jgi:hypothetical protein
MQTDTSSPMVAIRENSGRVIGVADNSGRIMGIGTAVLFGLVLFLNAFAF